MRTFIAIDIDEALRRVLTQVAGDLAQAGDKIKWVEPENFHVTLQFLGEVGDDVIREVCELAGQVARHIEPFEFSVAHLSCQPAHGPLRMIWAALDDPTGRMAELHRELGLALGELGLRQEDRRFRGHITLARIKFVRDPQRLRSAVREYGLDAFPLQHADEVVAYTSQLTAEGPIYAPLARLPIGRD